MRQNRRHSIIQFRSVTVKAKVTGSVQIRAWKCDSLFFHIYMPNPGGICQRLPLLRNGESTISRRLAGAACVTMCAVRTGVGAAAGKPLCSFVWGGGWGSKGKNKAKCCPAPSPRHRKQKPCTNRRTPPSRPAGWLKDGFP